MIKIVCSHCGEAVDNVDAMEIQLHTRRFPSTCWHRPLGARIAGTEQNDVHLCPKCQEELGNWLTEAMLCEFDWDERR